MTPRPRHALFAGFATAAALSAGCGAEKKAPAAPAPAPVVAAADETTPHAEMAVLCNPPHFEKSGMTLAGSFISFENGKLDYTRRDGTAVSIPSTAGASCVVMAREAEMNLLCAQAFNEVGAYTGRIPVEGFFMGEVAGGPGGLPVEGRHPASGLLLKNGVIRHLSGENGPVYFPQDKTTACILRPRQGT